MSQALSGGDIKMSCADGHIGFPINTKTKHSVKDYLRNIKAEFDFKLLREE
jgi:hypothetical protein